MMSNDNDAEVIEVDPSPEEEAPAPTSPSPSSKQSNIAMTRTESGRVATDIGKFHLEVEAKQVPLVGYFLASFIFMIAAIAQKRPLNNWYGYAVAIGVIGMVVALVGLVLLKYKAEIDQKYIAYGMVVWSVLGACFMTFRNGPFDSTGNGAYDGCCWFLFTRLHCIHNLGLIHVPPSFVLLLTGYFAVWAMVIFAVQHCGATQQLKEGVQSLSSLAGLGLAAIIMIIAISYSVSDDNYRGNAIYTVVLACFTVLVVAGVMYVERKEGLNFPAVYQFYALAVFAIMWVVAACLVTFNGPFVVSEIDEGEERISPCRSLRLLTPLFSSVGIFLGNWKRLFYSLGWCHFVFLCSLGRSAKVQTR
jgi:hypothetical protein